MNSDIIKKPWEVFFKEFILNEAEKHRTSYHTIYMRFWRKRRKYYPSIKLRKLNPRVVMVDTRSV